MIVHCILHGGPGLPGLSPATKHYLSTSKEAGDDQLQQSPPIVLADIADIDLQNLISELDSLPKDENPTLDARCAIEPYLYEAGLDPDNLYGNRKLLLEGLMVFLVLDKRCLELNDLAKGK
ncbi:hypothetical protein OS493_019404 [Desmophyllum pertusum]|uniref:Uncharacterized protein n=1 Tax=Desmophyllum pertusum TaxID=174260 RepID=A0A9X0D8I9_9CNID|nr:hypothetical protein OS493_019404 [Desmophyllum pertusum]